MNDSARFNLFLGLAGAAAVCLAFFAPSAFRFILLAFLLAYLVNPLVGALERRWKVPRGLSTALLLLLGFGLVALLLGLVVPYAVVEVEGLLSAAPDLLQQGFERLKELGVIRGSTPTATFDDILNLVKTQVAGKEASLVQAVAGTLLKATSGVIGVLLLVLNLVIIPGLFYFITLNLGTLREGFLSMVPASRRKGVEEYLAMADRTLGGFVRGQMIVALILAGVYGLGLTLAGLRFGLAIGIITGLLVVIPYAGFGLGIVLAALVTLVDFSGWGQVAGVTAAFAVGQSLETFVLTPNIVGDKVGLTPLEALISVLVFAELGGFLGLLLAIPVGGVLKQTILMAFKPREA